MEAEVKTTTEDGKTYYIPKWFIWVISVFMGVFTVICIPWAQWVTEKLIEISVKNEGAAEQRLDLKALAIKTSTLEADIKVLNSYFTRMSVMLEKIEDKMDRK